MPKTIKDLVGLPIPPPRSFHRGTSPEGKPVQVGDPFWDSMMFAADDPEKARPYGEHVRPLHAKPEAKILYEGTREFNALAKGFPKKGGSLLDHSNYVLKKAKEAGFDAVWFKRQGDVGTVILNPNAFEDPDRPAWERKGIMSRRVKIAHSILGSKSWWAVSSIVDVDMGPISWQPDSSSGLRHLTVSGFLKVKDTEIPFSGQWDVIFDRNGETKALRSPKDIQLDEDKVLDAATGGGLKSSKTFFRTWLTEALLEFFKFRMNFLD